MKHNTTKKQIFANLISYPVDKNIIQVNFSNTVRVASYEHDNYIGQKLITTTNGIFCPHCNAYTNRVKDRREIVLNSGSYASKIVLTQIVLKRFYCKQCNRSTTEKIERRTGSKQITDDIIDSTIKDLAFDTYTRAAKRLGESISTVMRHFDEYIQSIIEETPTQVEAIGVDEVAMIKHVLVSSPTREDRTLGYKRVYDRYPYQFVIVDHKTGHVLDIVNGRTKAIVLQLLREKYESFGFVSMDLWQTYRMVFLEEFPQACIIADKFHVVRNFTWAFSRSRIELCKEYNIGTTKHWRILTCRSSKLDENGLLKRDVMFDLVPELKPAYEAKEMAYECFKSKNLEEFRERFSSLCDYVYEHKIYHFYKALQTVKSWRQEIENMFLYPEYSNGRIERLNATIKKMKRNAHGYSNSGRTFALVKYRINRVA